MKNNMTVSCNGPSVGQCEWVAPERARRAAMRRDGPRDAEFLRHCAWEIGERRAAERYTPQVNHVGLAMVNPTQGFIHWHMLPEWVEQARERCRDSWHHCRMVVRLYDVSHIHFTGLNAHRIQDHSLPALCGQLFFPVPGGAGTWQLAEVGFLLRNGDFLPAARSQVVQFARDSASPHCDHTALWVDHERHVEEVGNVWDQDKFLAELNAPRLRSPLRIGSFAFESLASGQDTELARFVSELAAAQCTLGHEVHVFVPAAGEFTADLMRGGVNYHPLRVPPTESCLEAAHEFALSAAQALDGFPPFDLINCHEWTTGYAGWYGARPAVAALGSIEATRRGDAPPTEESQEIEQVERELAQSARCLLVPHGLWSRAVEELGPDDRAGARVLDGGPAARRLGGAARLRAGQDGGRDRPARPDAPVRRAARARGRGRPDGRGPARRPAADAQRPPRLRGRWEPRGRARLPRPPARGGTRRAPAGPRRAIATVAAAPRGGGASAAVALPDTVRRRRGGPRPQGRPPSDHNARGAGAPRAP